MVATSTRWSLYAGVYAFLCGVALIVPLGAVAKTVVRILTLPPALTVVLVPGSGAVLAAGIWWLLVERRGEYTYLLGGAAWLATALLTVALWTVLVAAVYGPMAVAVGGVVILVTLLVAGPVAVIAGLPMMYARRRLAGADGPAAE